MNINKSNFEEICVDYFDGNLNPEEVEMLMRFLSENPDLASSFWDYDPGITLNSELIVFHSKEGLKRGYITQENADYYLAAYTEGDLDSADRERVRAYVAQNSRFLLQLQWMQSAKLRPDLKVVFTKKKSLKKPVIISLRTRIVRWSSVAAAIVAIVVSVVLYMQVSAPEFSRRSLEQPEEYVLAKSPDPAVEHPALPSNASTRVSLFQEVSQAAEMYNDIGSEKENQIDFFDGFYNSISIIPLVPITAFVENIYEPYHPQSLQPNHYVLLLNAETSSEQFLLAYRSPAEWISRISINLAEDLNRVEQRLSQNKPSSLLGLAGASLIGFNQLLGSPVNVRSRTNENGQTLSVALGRNFELTRSTP